MPPSLVLGISFITHSAHSVHHFTHFPSASSIFPSCSSDERQYSAAIELTCFGAPWPLVSSHWDSYQSIAVCRENAEPLELGSKRQCYEVDKP